MRMLTPAFAAVLLAATPALAQEQQAGGQGTVDTEETFQKLIEQCDNIDVLVMRGRIRLLLPRTTPEAAAEAEAMLNQGLAACGEGKIEEAKATLQEANDLANAGVTEKFGQDASPDVATEAATEPEQATAEVEEQKKPWWQIW